MYMLYTCSCALTRIAVKSTCIVVPIRWILYILKSFRLSSDICELYVNNICYYNK